ncbi:MAG TPA: class I SAM-dependent methyltransferase [Blastocatellia bacterium]|jgi:SAM-dependent methyltransferase|nr:class I SAM-dependent methyltransferase [Blastocatellia bacterium]
MKIREAGNSSPESGVAAAVAGVSAFDLPTLDKIPVIKELLRVAGEGLALDIGIGTGYTTFHVFGNRPTVCVDLHRPNLEYFRDRMRNASAAEQPGVVAMATALPFRSGAFRFVLCSEVLEHLEDDDSAVREISRVLSQDGRAVITVPYTGIGFTGFLEALRIKTVHDFPGPEFHVRPGYDERSLAALLARHGLEIERHAFYMRFFTRVAVDMVSLSHIIYQRLAHGRRSWTWSEAAEAEGGLAFRLYTLAFPLLQAFSKMDRLIGGRRGFGLVASVRKSSAGERRLSPAQAQDAQKEA